MPLLLAALCLCVADAPAITFDPDAGPTGAVEVRGLSPDQLEQLAAAAQAAGWPAILALRVASADAESPAMLGSYAVDGDVLRFTPRFPLRPGLNYRAVFVPPGGLRNLRPLEATVAPPAPPESPRAAVEHVYPSRELLPENQLKFYLHFTRPMSQGDSYRRLRLLDADGRPVELPFLELGEELWDETGTRLTVFIDPGRIKRGLKPREDVGPVFEQGRTYTLVIAADWPDADGRPLAREHRKPIRVAPPDHRQPDPARWKIEAPPAGATDPLTVRFDEPLDHALLHRVLRVVGPDGRPIAGRVAVDRDETRWRFTPQRAWTPGRHALHVETILEDLAGNSLARPFETEIERSPQRDALSDTLSIPFEVRLRPRELPGCRLLAPRADQPTRRERVDDDARRVAGAGGRFARSPGPGGMYAARAAHGAENWPQWRGPHGNGVAPEADPPVEWSEEKNVRWKVEVPGSGSSTPIIWGDRIFLLTAIPADAGAGEPAAPRETPPRRGRRGRPQTVDGPQKFVVLCLDRRTGQTRWARTVREERPHEGRHDTNTYASGSPTTDGRFLYASFGSRGIYCLDMQGNVVWERDLGDMQTRNGFGEGSSPALHGDTLVVPWDHEGPSFIAALDARTGQTRWKVARDEVTTWATPLIVEHDGRMQVVTNGTHRARSYDLETGRLIWECGGQATNPIATPVAGDGLVYLVTGHRGYAVTAVPLDATGDLTGTDRRAWHRDDIGSYIASPLLLGDRLYVTKSRDAVVACLDARTGETVAAERRLPGLTTLYASPLAAAGRIYYTDRNGTTAVLQQGPKLEVLATNHLNEGVDASPVAVGRQLFLRGTRHLYCLEESHPE